MPRVSTTGCRRQCVSCHQADYNGTTDPNHRAAGFPRPAGPATRRRRGSARRTTTPRLPSRLTGAHLQAACSSCHASGVYNGLSTACASCHQSELRRHDGPESQGGRLPDDMRDLPFDDALGWRDLQPFPVVVPSDGSAPSGGLLSLPCLGCLQRTVHGLRVLPPGRLRRDDGPESQSGGIPDDLRFLPHDDDLDRRDLQPFSDLVPIDRGAPSGSLLVVPRLGRVQRAVDGLRVLPPGRLRRHDGSQSPGGRLPDDLRVLPHDDDLDRRDLQP